MRHERHPVRESILLGCLCIAYVPSLCFWLYKVLPATIRLEGVRALYFNTQWTFAIVTLYFGGGRNVPLKTERNAYDAVPQDADASYTEKDADALGQSCDQATAGLFGYSFQVIFQVAAGAAMLSDSVFWLLIYPLLLPESFRLGFLVFSMHSFNTIFLTGCVFLNSVRFPFFRIAYFSLWTIIYVIFQWIVHACFSMWWPYPFLDLSSPCGPAWYLAIGLIMLTCFGLFALIVKLKHFLLSKFPESG